MAMKPLTLIAMALGTAVLLICGILRRNNDFTIIQTTYTANFDSYNCDVVMKQLTEIEVQRNQLSASLNSLQEQHQKLVCTANQQGGTSETGGWCNSGVDSQHVTDVPLANALAELLANKTVVGFGDGLGKYRRLLLDSGAVKRYDAYDGAPNIGQITDGQVSFLDLTLPQYWLPTYDWVVILEVVEHIPGQFENIVLDNVARFAGSGVVMSWAVPWQLGFHHVNSQSHSYVLNVMRQKGFVLDSLRSLKLQQAASRWWFRRNIQVFRRSEV